MGPWTRRTDEDFGAEVEAHLALEADRLVAEGLSPDEARAAAVQRFGNVTAARERFHESRRIMWLDHLWQDIRYGCRTFRRSRGFTLTSVSTVAIGLGLAIAMISVLEGTLWRSLPFPEADRLVSIRGLVSYPTLLELSSTLRSFENLTGYRNKRYTLTGRGETTSLRATVSSGSLFSVLRTPAARGRALSQADDRANLRPVVLSDRAWRSVFCGDTGIVGRTIYLNRVSFVVVGVMPPGLRFPTNVDQIDLYTTVAADLQVDSRQAERSWPHDLQMIARLKPGVLLSQAQTEMSVASALTGKRRELDIRRTGLVVPLNAEVSGSLAAPLRLLTYAVECVLAISWVTAAILALIRVHGRRAELAMRLAVGATRPQIARQLLVESTLISLAGGCAGAVLAVLCTGPLLSAAGSALSAATARFDFRVLVVALLVSLTTGVAFGIVPALRAAATGWPRAARHSERTAGRTTGKVPWLLVTTETALTVMLLAASISLLRSYLILSHVDAGFDPTRVLTFRIDLSDAQYSPRQQVDFFRDVRTRIGPIPGVKASAFTALLPFGDVRFTTELVSPDGTATDGERDLEVHLVSPGFFAAMGIPLHQGRDFTSGDVLGRTRVAIASRSLAHRCFRAGEAVGRSLELAVGPDGAAHPMVEIIGVAGDVHNGTLAAPSDPQIYVPLSQAPMVGSTTFVVRLAESDAAAVLSAVRRQVRAIDAGIAVVDPKPLADYVAGSLLQPRFNTLLVSLFAGAAIVLAMAGLYAVVSYVAQRRRHEYSIRVALGATQESIVRLVLNQCLVAVMPGIVLGFAGAIMTSQLLQKVLFGVRAAGITTLLVAAVVACGSSLLAAWKPAHNAGSNSLRGILQWDGEW